MSMYNVYLTDQPAVDAELSQLIGDLYQPAYTCFSDSGELRGRIMHVRLSIVRANSTATAYVVLPELNPRPALILIQ